MNMNEVNENTFDNMNEIDENIFHVSQLHLQEKQELSSFASLLKIEIGALRRHLDEMKELEHYRIHRDGFIINYSFTASGCRKFKEILDSANEMRALKKVVVEKTESLIDMPLSREYLIKWFIAHPKSEKEPAAPNGWRTRLVDSWEEVAKEHPEWFHHGKTNFGRKLKLSCVENMREWIMQKDKEKAEDKERQAQ